MSGISPWKWLKKVDVFWPPFGLNNDYGRILKGCLSLMGVERRPAQFGVSVTLPTQSCGWLRHFPCCKTQNRGCSWCQKCSGEHWIWINPTKRLGTFKSGGKQVGRSSTPCQKRRYVFGVEKVNSGQNICSRDTSVGNGKHFEKQAKPSKR